MSDYETDSARAIAVRLLGLAGILVLALAAAGWLIWRLV